MRKLLSSQVDECRRGINRVAKRLKVSSKIGGKGAAKVSAGLAAVNLKLAEALSVELYDPDAEDEEAQA